MEAIEILGQNAIPFVIVAETGSDLGAREALLNRAMGLKWKRKSSQKLRRGRRPSEGLAFVARGEEGALAGTVRLWDVATGDGRPALLLGPLAVEPSLKSAGIGKALMSYAISEARAARSPGDTAGRRRAVLRAFRLHGGEDRCAFHAWPIRARPFWRWSSSPARSMARAAL